MHNFQFAATYIYNIYTHIYLLKTKTFNENTELSAKFINPFFLSIKEIWKDF